ncbi:MAG: hypothetical protein JEZ06_17030 [Anaerolineaceae bacterium]|nr:hypothetical protein [Anaerolineaceae bacterium]
MAMGFEGFFTRMVDDPGFIHKLLQDRSDWVIGMFRKAESLILGEDT